MYQKKLINYWLLYISSQKVNLEDICKCDTVSNLIEAGLGFAEFQVFKNTMCHNFATKLKVRLSVFSNDV